MLKVNQDCLYLLNHILYLYLLNVENESIFVDIQNKMRAWHELCREEPNLKWELKKANADLEDHRKRREMTLAESDRDIKSMQSEIDAIQDTLETMHREKEELTSDLELKSNDIARQELENSALRNEVEEMKRCVDLNVQNKEVAILIKSLTSKCGELASIVNDTMPADLARCNDSIARIQENVNEIIQGDTRLLTPLPDSLLATIESSLIEMQKQAAELIETDKFPIEANIQAIKDRKVEEQRKFESKSAKINEMVKNGCTSICYNIIILLMNFIGI